MFFIFSRLDVIWVRIQPKIYGTTRYEAPAHAPCSGSILDSVELQGFSIRILTSDGILEPAWRFLLATSHDDTQNVRHYICLSNRCSCSAFLN